MTIAGFVALTAGLVGFHPSKRQPLTGTQKLWEGVRFLSSAVVGLQTVREWERAGWHGGEGGKMKTQV